jgi:hypothetical protein
VILLIRPFDCFAAGAPSRQMADCCLKGNCVPTAKSDECCKISLPDSNQFVISKAAAQSSPLIAVDVTGMPSLLVAPAFEGIADPLRHPPPRVSLASDSLPLLI